MARKYPRFIYSNPQNTKSKGPFVVHLLEPRVVFKVITEETFDADATAFVEEENIGLALLDPIKSPDDRVAIYKVISAGIDWLLGQIKSEEVKL